jgi:hypothetical protein
MRRPGQGGGAEPNDRGSIAPKSARPQYLDEWTGEFVVTNASRIAWRCRSCRPQATPVGARCRAFTTCNATRQSMSERRSCAGSVWRAAAEHLVADDASPSCDSVTRTLRLAPLPEAVPGDPMYSTVLLTELPDFGAPRRPLRRPSAGMHRRAAGQARGARVHPAPRASGHDRQRAPVVRAQRSAWSAAVGCRFRPWPARRWRLHRAGAWRHPTTCTA